MSGPTSEKPALQMNRVIAAPRERVFAAWTTPNDIKAWFGPDDCSVLDVRIDLRVGGEYCFHLSTERLGEIKVRGCYSAGEIGLYLAMGRSPGTYAPVEPGQR
jgi:uncharacterized protein YndB with AHSA1/START domain